MRIIRGRFKTRRYSIPKSFPSRPTTDFAKEGLFNVLDHMQTMDGLNILDLCAGTGNISFEFLSREAGTLTSVDKNYNCVKHIQMLAKSFDCEDEIMVVKSDILKFLKQTSAKYDLIFADPPYEYEHYDQIHEIVWERDLLTEGGMLILEHSKRTSLESRPHFLFSRKYGNVHFSFFQISEDNA